MAAFHGCIGKSLLGNVDLMVDIDLWGADRVKDMQAA